MIETVCNNCGNTEPGAIGDCEACGSSDVSQRENRTKDIRIRETLYELERDYGAEAVVEQFKFVIANDDAFADARGSVL